MKKIMTRKKILNIYHSETEPFKQKENRKQKDGVGIPELTH